MLDHLNKVGPFLITNSFPYGRIRIQKSQMNPISFLIISFFCNSPLVRGISTIKPGEQLTSDNVLVSQGGNFTLGFFTIPETNYSYLGIWYSNVQRRKVWIANRNTPLNSSSAALTVDDTTGILKITSGGNTVLNVSDQVAVGSSVTATLQDSGNLVVTEETERRNLWQSFDHPTSTLLPGMKIGFDTATGQNWSLTSWLSPSFPASGTFTLSWEPTQESGQLVVFRRGERYWASGLLNDQTFENMPTLNSPGINNYYNLSFVSTTDEKYLTFNGGINGSSWMWVLHPDGTIRDDANNLRIQPDFCYGYESNNGCVTSELPTCRGSSDRFDHKKVSFNAMVVTSHYDENLSLSLSDCMERCWNDCSCVGFRASSKGTGCITWTGKLHYQEANVDTVPIYVLDRGNSSEVLDRGNSSEVLDRGNSSKGSSKGKTWVWIVVAVAICLLVLIVGTFCFLRMRKRRLEGEEKKRRKEYIRELIPSDSFNNVRNIEDDGTEGHHDLKMLSFASIVEATNSFSQENELGKGGFGPVYKGKLQDGREIAVKRLSRTSRQGLVEFKNELILIAKLQHKNLVRVLGCCIHGEEKMLVYEYLPNKSLDSFIFDPAKRELLDWKIRLSIIDGVAQGLLYLHKYSRMRVIHRDLKANNVLLDENMNAKISDFGMARIFKQNETEAVTNRIVGTHGYMSPEYAMEGTFSEKSDVFSFGVLILEIVSGRRNTSFYDLDNSRLNLIGYAWELWTEGTALELKDPTLGDSCSPKQLLRIIHVGLLCVQEGATDRPTMSDVIYMLSNETTALPALKRPAFSTGRNELNTPTSKDCSINNLTVTVMDAR